MRRLLQEFIACLRERPFSYKIAYCRDLAIPAGLDIDHLRVLYDSTEYLMGRVVIADAIRRHQLPVDSTMLHHMASTGNRYILKDVLLALLDRRSPRTLVRVAKMRTCQEEPLLRFLLIRATRAQGLDPNAAGIPVNSEQEEFSEDEARAWSLWTPLDGLIAAVNDHAKVPADTVRLMLFENRETLAEELARDLSDVFNISPEEIRFLTRRRLISLLSKYVDLSYLVCQALSEGDFRAVEERLAQEARKQPPSVLLPPESIHQLPTREDKSHEPESPGGRGTFPEFDETFPEERLLDPGHAPASHEPEPLTLADIPFEPGWARIIPRVLAEELLVIPLRVEGSPPERITLGCATPETESIRARLRHLNCELVFRALSEELVREAIRRSY